MNRQGDRFRESAEGCVDWRARLDSNASTNENVLPCPTALATSIRPPIRGDRVISTAMQGRQPGITLYRQLDLALQAEYLAKSRS
jgi:hypothetical protein